MQDEVSKLRIAKAHKPRHVERARWPWLIVIALLLVVGIIIIQRRASAAITVQTTRVVPQETSG